MKITNHIGFRPTKENLQAIATIAVLQNWSQKRGAKSRFINEALRNHIRREVRKSEATA